MVIGGGIAGITAALNLANAGKHVYLVERQPTIGGHMAQFDKTFPTLDCAACILTPKMVDAGAHPNITLHTWSEVVDVSGSVGDFKIKVKHKPRMVVEADCTGCGICWEKCPVQVVDTGFEAGIDAGAMAVMTAYNKVNGEWAGQSGFVINDLLRDRLGFRWLVMTDWTSVWDGEKVIRSGQDLEMPHAAALEGTKALLEEEKIEQAAIDRMARSILRTTLAMGLHDRPQVDSSLVAKYPEHERIALETAREGLVLLAVDRRLDAIALISRHYLGVRTVATTLAALSLLVIIVT